MLTREECLAILELDASASTWDIENKYTIQVKKYRSIDSDEARDHLDKIAMAYNILTGRYVEPEPINPKLERVVAGKSLKQWQTVWHYGRWPLLAIVVAIVVVIYFIVSIATNKPSDFSVVIMGSFSDGGSAVDTMTDYLQDNSDEKITNPDIHYLPIDFSNAAFNPDESEVDPSSLDMSAESQESSALTPQFDPQSQYAYNMKLVTLLFSDEIDIFMSSQAAFDRYAPQGVFVDMAELYESLADLPPEILAEVKPVYAVLDEETTDSSDDNSESNESDNTDGSTNMLTGESVMYGLDISGLDIFEGMDIWFGDGQIISIGFKSRDSELAGEMIASMIRDYAELGEKAEIMAAEHQQG